MRLGRRLAVGVVEDTGQQPPPVPAVPAVPVAAETVVYCEETVYREETVRVEELTARSAER